MPLPRLDVVSFCAARGIPYAAEGRSKEHHVRSGWVGLPCPFCGDGRTGFHLAFHVAGGNLACWRCGGHSAWSWVSSVLGTGDKRRIAQEFLDHPMDPVSTLLRERPKPRKRVKELPPIPDLGPLRRRHREYLESRGFNPRRLEAEWDLQGTRHLSGPWSWRIVAPIRDQTGLIVARVGRSIRRSVKLRYKEDKEEDCLADPRTFLYGIDKASEEGVVVVEGPADVWRLGPGAVGVRGIGWKRQQADILRGFKRRFILFDSVDKDDPNKRDENAQRRARKLADYLAMFPGHTEVVDGFGSDPGDFSDEQAREVMKELLG